MEITLGRVTSKDGTVIGYRQVGNGPGLVIVHGSMSTGYNHIQLAQRLADRFTVYLPDRRGRGLSGPYRAGHTIESDVDDLGALLSLSGARNLFGVSFGGIVCLQAALELDSIGSLAVYEPPLRMRDPQGAMQRFDAEMAGGNVARALVIAMKASQMGPRIFDVFPSWLLVLMTRQWLKSMDRKGTGEYASFGTLAPTLHYETQVIVTATANIGSLRGVTNEVLLLGGSKSGSTLKAALDSLVDILPNAQRAELRGLGHSGAWNADVGGNPERVAPSLLAFFDAANTIQEAKA